MSNRKQLGIVGGPWPGIAKEKCGTCAWWGEYPCVGGADGMCFYEPLAHPRGSEVKACHHWVPTAEDAADYPDDVPVEPEA